MPDKAVSQPTLPEGALASRARMAIWLPWYFKRGSVSILTVPVLLFLAWGSFDSISAADRNPCAAYKPGVTDSMPPKSDCFAPVPAQAQAIVSDRDLTCMDFSGLQDSQKMELAYGYLEGVQAVLEKDAGDIIVPPSDARHPMWWVLPAGLGQNAFIGLAQKLDQYCKSEDKRHQKLLDAFLSLAYQKTGWPAFGISLDESKTDPWKKILAGEESSVSCSAYSASPEQTRQAIVDGYYLGTQGLKARFRAEKMLWEDDETVWPSKSSPHTVRIEVDKGCEKGREKDREKDKAAKLRDVLWVTTVEMAVKQK